MTDLTLPAKTKKKITYTASSQGIEKAEKALQRLGKESKSKFAESIQLSRTTVTKFFARQPIQLDGFKTICDALTLDWREIGNIEKQEAPSIEEIVEIEEVTVPEEKEEYSTPDNAKTANYSTMTQIIQDNARGWQTKVEGGTAYIGENTIHKS
ncbi:hypothetical protein CAL7716_057360 [Calothrix sp. PCC 7716]|nr:hypothetical protein CAL7716_057360 [Calothrix sp. PCC 7716]